MLTLRGLQATVSVLLQLAQMYLLVKDGVNRQWRAFHRLLLSKLL